MCDQKKLNKRIHKTLEIDYNFPSKVYEKSIVRNIDDDDACNKTKTI